MCLERLLTRCLEYADGEFVVLTAHVRKFLSLIKKNKGQKALDDTCIHSLMSILKSKR